MKKGRLSLQVFLITLTLPQPCTHKTSINVYLFRSLGLLSHFSLWPMFHALFHFDLNQHFVVLIRWQLMEEKP